MSAAIIIIFLSLMMGKSGEAIKPVVTFTPNWGNVLQSDSVTITCNVPSTAPEEPRTYHWYKDKRPISGDQQTLPKISFGVQDSGDYQCRISGSDISDPVTLNVTNNYVILQRPPSAIYEGDPLTLRCHHVKEYSSYPPRFYRNNEEIISQFPDSKFHIQKVDLNTSAHYKCTKRIAPPGRSDFRKFSDEFSVSVKELFSPPEIKIAADWVKEGDEMTVRCGTRLNPLRGGTKLHFAFYRDGGTVREYNVSDTYRVRSAQLKDSGNYTCEVRTVSETVKKMSDGIYIRIYRDAIRPVVTFTPNWGNVLQDDEVTLTCNVPSTVPEEPRTYHWYRNNQPIPGDQQTLQIISSGVRDSGDYQCRISDSDISDPITLNVTNSCLILQRPPSAIYEGDPLTLRCHHSKDFSGFLTRFFKNNEEIISQFPDSEFRIQKVDLNTSGHYKCTKRIISPGISDYPELSDEFPVSVKELFSPPKIKVTPPRIIEGGEMTVRCDTRLDPLRGGTELHFAFYRDGRTVREYNVSDTYRVPSSQLEDSGNYTCEVRTMSGTVRKMSDGIYIQINGEAIRPVVTFTPNWGNVLQDDEVTLTCNVPSTVPEEPRTYHWYRNNQPIPGDQQTLQIISSGVRDSGDYQCRISDSDISDPITLNVTNSRLILQRPPSAIYEGDPLTLRCHHSKDFSGFLTRFFKNNEEIISQFPDSEFRIQKVDLNTSGHYKCTKRIISPGISDYPELSDEFPVSVKELFSPPKIKVTPPRIIEGGEMTVRCDTRLDPLRGGTELHFAFYRDGRTVWEYNVSDTYRVPSSQLEDSGNYTCEVRTMSGTVRKMSDGIYIQINDYTAQNIIRLVISGFVLAASLCFIYFHNKW